MIDTICHVCLTRQFRNAERQAELLVRGLAGWNINQRLLVTAGHRLITRLAEVTGLEIRECSGSLVGAAIRTGSADLMHAHDPAAGRAATLASVLRMTPVVLTLREPPDGTGVFARRSMSSAAAAVVPTKFLRKRMAADHPHTPCVLISDAAGAYDSFPANVERLRQKYEGKYIIGHVGAMNLDDNGQLTLLGVAREIKGTHPDVLFLFVGSGPDAGRLREAAAGLSNIEVVGEADNVGDYLELFDAFAYPTLRAGSPSHLLDALDFALPAVASRVGGIGEIVKDGTSGFLVEPGNVDQLRFALLRIHDDPSLAETLGENGRAAVQPFAPQRMVEQYLDLYQAVTGAGDLPID